MSEPNWLSKWRETAKAAKAATPGPRKKLAEALEDLTANDWQVKLGRKHVKL